MHAFKKRRRITIGGYTHIRELDGGVLPPRTYRINPETIIGEETTVCVERDLSDSGGLPATWVAPPSGDGARIASYEVLEAFNKTVLDGERERWTRILDNPFSLRELSDSMSRPGFKLSPLGRVVWTRLWQRAFRIERSWRLRDKRYRKKVRVRRWAKRAKERLNERMRVDPKVLARRYRGVFSEDEVRRIFFETEFEVGRGSRMIRFKLVDWLDGVRVVTYSGPERAKALVVETETEPRLNRLVVYESLPKKRRFDLPGYFSKEAPLRFSIRKRVTLNSPI